MAYIVSFLVTVIVILALRRYAEPIGLIVDPGGHRLHERSTPLVGGVGMFAGLTCGYLLLGGPLVLWACGAVVVISGVWDDIHELSTSARFLAQIGAAAVVIYWGDVVLYDLGYLVSPDFLLYLGRWAVALSIFGTVGLINAINMSDGMDGLAGSLTFVSLSVILIAGLHGEMQQTVAELGILLCVVAAFLIFNVRFTGSKPAGVFMGDAGSMLLGLALAWYVVKLTQEPVRLFAPVTALWIVALPLFDTVGALLRRVVKGQSPFSADRSHYHHYLLDMGLTVNQVLLISVAVSASCAMTGLLAYYAGIPEHVMFYAFLLLFVVYLVVMEVAQRKLKN